MEIENTFINENKDNFANLILTSELAKLRDNKTLSELEKARATRAVIYLRVSTPDQARKDRASLPEQEKQAMDLITRNGLVHVGTYKDEGKSGTKTEGRDDYLRLKEDAKLRKFDVVVVWDFDRLSRNTLEMMTTRDELRKSGVQITSVNCPIEIDDPRNLSLEMSFDKEMLTTMMAIVAKEENRKRVLRMSLGKIDNARKGLIPCRVPYGYRKIVKYIGGEKSKKIQYVVIYKPEAIVVVEIFNLYDQKGWGMRKIAEYLNLKGIPASRGGKWDYSSIRYVLANYTYTGLVRWGWYLCRSKAKRLQLANGGKGIIAEGKHPKIIEPEQFSRVKAKLNARYKMGGRAASSTGLLVGIAKCGRCGGATYVTKWPHWFAYRHNKKDREKYTDTYSYMCANYSRFGRSGCTSRYVMSKGKLEKAVVRQIEKLAESKEAQEAFVKKMKQNNKSQILRDIDSIALLLKEIEKRATRQKAAYDSGVTSLNEYKEDIARNESEKLELTQKLENKRIEATQEIKIENQSRKSLLALTNFKKIWGVTDFSQKKNLLSSILDKVIVKGNQIEVVFAHL